jgi:hypothetical protein
LLGVVLTSLCFVATGENVGLGALLAALLVPTGVRTYLVLARDRAAGNPTSFESLLDALFSSAALTVALGGWLLIVSAITSILRDSGLVELPLFALVVLTILLVVSIHRRRSASEARQGKLNPDWRRLFRPRFTVREMLAGVAFVAFALWPIHNWWMRPTYLEIAKSEAWVAAICQAELELMAERAKQCVGRASERAAWDRNDELSEDLKVCPYPSDGPGRSWAEQAEIWERAAERSRMAAHRHREIARTYDPWFK